MLVNALRFPPSVSKYSLSNPVACEVQWVVERTHQMPRLLILAVGSLLADLLVAELQQPRRNPSLVELEIQED